MPNIWITLQVSDSNSSTTVPGTARSAQAMVRKPLSAARSRRSPWMTRTIGRVISM